ncbi:MAG: glycosyltransferase family 2 protein [Eubacteriales bacterium]|nr:glycosyltransferase family 2 protein [Eubacteriales bacterium]
MSDVLIIIPAYNEAQSIERVVDELIESYPQYDYVVVTDGPTDGTDEICRRRGYNTVFLPRNMGLTKCFKNGMSYALEKGYKYAVQFDGDGQHRPEYIEPMEKKANEGYDIVQGSRFLGDKDARMGVARALGAMLIKRAIYKKTGVRMTDPTCGMRMYGRTMIDDFVNKEDISPEPDTIAKLIKGGARFAEVPVKVVERTTGESYLNFTNAIKYMKRILSAIRRV